MMMRDAEAGVLDALREGVRQRDLVTDAMRSIIKYAEAAWAMDKYGIAVSGHPTKKQWIACWGRDGDLEHEIHHADFCTAVHEVRLRIETGQPGAEEGDES